MKHTVAALLQKPELEDRQNSHQQSLEQEAEEKFQRARRLWVQYMHVPDKLRGYPRRDATCKRANSNYSATVEDKDFPYTQSDLRIMQTFNACVDSLEPYERSAVYKAHGLGDPFRFLRMPYEETLAGAMRKLRVLVAARC